MFKFLLILNLLFFVSPLRSFELAQHEDLYIQTPEDYDNLDLFKTVYKKNSKLKIDNHHIPKIIHFIWLGTEELSQSSLTRMGEWVKKHPDWQCILWTDQDLQLPIPKIEVKQVKDFEFKQLGHQYKLASNFGEKSEILRYEILWQMGGLYADHDTYPRKKFDKLQAKYDFFCGLERIGPSILSSSVFPSTHLIAAKPGHPILEKTMQWLKANWDEVERLYPVTDFSSLYNRVKHRSFTAFLKGVKQGIDKEGNYDIVFPSTFFSVPKNARYSNHAHTATWHQPIVQAAQFIKRIQKIEKKTEHTLAILILIAALNSAAFIFLFFKKKRMGQVSFLLAAFPLLMSFVSVPGMSEFEKFMGKDTGHWKYVDQDVDKEALERYEKLYEKNKIFLSFWKSSEKIPKVVHFIWLGPKNFPPQSVENIRTWISKHPDWKVKFWTDRPRAVPCEGMELVLIKDSDFDFLGKRFHDSENYGEQSDLLRFEILYREGGVYVDHDANCLLPFDNLHSNFDFYCGLETPHPAFVGLNITSGNGVLGAKPGHPVIKKVIDIIDAHWDEVGKRFSGHDPATKVERVMQRTYIALTLALRDSVDKNQNVDIVLPAAYFFSKSGVEPLYSKHFYATAWGEEKAKATTFEKDLSRYITKTESKGKKVQLITLLILVINSVMMCSIFLFKKKND